MFIEILLAIAIATQLVASVYALGLVRSTKYNAIWWLFFVSFMLLSVERILQLVMINGAEIPLNIFWWTGLVVSVGLSVGVMYANQLFKYIDRLNHQRQYTSRRILSAVIRTEEKSLSKFSKELHDGMGPLLSSAKMSLSALSSSDVTPEQKAIIDDTAYLINEAISSLREISNNLSPHVLNDFGIVKGIQNFINKSSALSGVKIEFRCNMHSQRIDRDIEVVLYRVVCELVNNSIKHAHCTTIDIILLKVDETLRLVYRDNGVGFSPQPIENRGMGLSNISSRVSSISGELKIESSEGEGMSARINIPLDRAGALIERKNSLK